MTVSSEVSRSGPYNGNGATTVFPYDFKIFAAADLLVTEVDLDGVETTLVLNTDYTVDGVLESGGGNVTLTTALTGDGTDEGSHKLTIRRVLEATQTMNLRNQGKINAEVLERAHDRAVMLIQQLMDERDRSLRLPESEAGSELLTILPPLAERKGANLSFDPTTGQPTATNPTSASVSAAMQPVVASATQALALSAFGFGGIFNVRHYGAVGDGTTDDTVAIQAAITAAQTAGRGIVLFPPAIYKSGNLSITGARVTIWGYGARLRNGRITASAASTDLSVHGLHILDDTSDANSYLLDISATRFLVEDVTLEKSPAAGGYQGYIRDASSYGIVRGLRTFGSNGIYIAGHDHAFVGCELESNMSGGAGGDDGYVIKGLAQTYNISITGGTVRGHQAILSIGSEVGDAGAAGTYTKYVRNVTVTGVTAYNCAGIAFIKPGALAADYRNGLVENIQIAGCTLIDQDGFLFASAIQIWAGRAAIVRNVQISDCTVRARAKSNAVTNTGVTITVKNQGLAATIEDIAIDGLRITDTYDGVANAGPTPGYPIDWGFLAELENTSLGSIKRVTVSDMFVRGTRIGGAFTGASLTGPIRFERPIFRKIANNPPSAVQGGFYPLTEMGIYDAEVETLSGRAVGADALTSATYKSQKATFCAGTAGAAAALQTTGWVAPCDCYVWKIELTNNGAIAQSDVDYVTMEIRNLNTGNVLVQANTKVTGGIAIPDDTPIAMQAATLVGVNAFFPAGSGLRFANTQTGAGRALTMMNVVVHYVPYSR